MTDLWTAVKDVPIAIESSSFETPAPSDAPNDIAPSDYRVGPRLSPQVTCDAKHVGVRILSGASHRDFAGPAGRR